MPVTTDLPNLGDAQLCRETVAGIEHLLGEKRGSVAGIYRWDAGQRELRDSSRGTKYLRTDLYCGGAGGEHKPQVICRLILQLVPIATS
jgi:hypothetical protein